MDQELYSLIGNGNGQFTVNTQFPTAGEYKVVADFTPTGMGAKSCARCYTPIGCA